MDIMYCFKCKTEFSAKKSLVRHMLEAHDITYVATGMVNNSNFCCVEENCNQFFINCESLRNHLWLGHGINKSSVQEKQFVSLEDFQEWFEQEQRNTTTNYYLKQTRRTADAETSYYYCHRSGKTHTTVKQESLRKRKKKCQGSCKINSFCTSQLILKKDAENKCSVRYFYEHYGHEIEIQHVRIHKQELESTPVTQIGVNDFNNADGLDLLDPKDTNNIKASYSILIENEDIVIDDAAYRIITTDHPEEVVIKENVPIEETYQLDYKQIDSLKADLTRNLSNIADDVKINAYSYERLKRILKHLKIINSMAKSTTGIEGPSQSNGAITETSSKKIKKKEQRSLPTKRKSYMIHDHYY